MNTEHMSRRDFLRRSAETAGKIALVSIAAPLVSACRFVDTELPPTGEMLTGGEKIYLPEQLHAIHRKLENEEAFVHFDNPEVARYITSVMFYSLLANKVPEEEARIRSQRISVDFQENGAHTCLGDACVHREGWVQLAGHISEKPMSWNTFRFLLAHEAGHHATQPKQETQIVAESEDYGFAQYYVYSDDGFNPVIVNKSLSAPELLYQQHDFGNGKIGQICRIEELYAERAAVAGSNYMKFFLALDSAPYHYAFAQEAIHASTTREPEHSTLFEPWQTIMSFDNFNAFFMNNNRKGFFYDLGGLAFAQNPPSEDIPKNYQCGFGLVLANSMMCGRKNEWESAERLLKDPITIDAIEDSAWFENTQNHGELQLASTN